jgi:hypothetical protein
MCRIDHSYSTTIYLDLLYCTGTVVHILMAAAFLLPILVHVENEPCERQTRTLRHKLYI